MEKKYVIGKAMDPFEQLLNSIRFPTDISTDPHFLSKYTLKAGSVSTTFNSFSRVLQTARVDLNSFLSYS